MHPDLAPRRDAFTKELILELWAIGLSSGRIGKLVNRPDNGILALIYQARLRGDPRAIAHVKGVVPGSKRGPYQWKTREVK